MKRRYAPSHRWRHAQSIDELATMASSRLPAFAWEYLNAGAEDEHTLNDNRSAFQRWQWRPRTLVDLSEIDSRTTLLGQECAMPLAIAPTGYNGMLWRDADIALARAAQRHDMPFTLSTVSCNSLEEVATAVPAGRLWFQLYPLRDKSATQDLIERAQAANAEALVVTTDAVVLGRREWDSRSYLNPRRLTMGHTLDALCHPRWAAQALWPNGLPTLGNLLKYLPAGEHSAASAATYISQQMATDLTWEALAEIRQQWSGKLIIKGILNAEDARRCQRLGADAIVVTNHGGRQLDGSPASLDCLPPIVDAVGKQLEILLDSGIRRGSDIAKALALGANGVLSGRATLYGLAVGGEAGAHHALTLLQQQLHNTLALLGRPCVSQLDRDCLGLPLHLSHDNAHYLTANSAGSPTQTVQPTMGDLS
ncbi:alpha-hydroxy acid oxidase [Halomonas sp. AOP13-D3-9]